MAFWPPCHTGLIAAEMAVLLEVLLSLMSDKWPSSSWSPPRLRSFYPDASWTASSRKSPGGSELLPLRDDGGHCALRHLQSSRDVSVPFPKFVPAWFVLWRALMCTAYCQTLYRQVCALPNHVQSTEFTTDGLQKLQQHLKGDQRKQDAPELYSELCGKGCEYLSTCDFLAFLKFYSKTLQKNNVFPTSLCGVLCGILREKSE